MLCRCRLHDNSSRELQKIAPPASVATSSRSLDIPSLSVLSYFRVSQGIHFTNCGSLLQESKSTNGDGRALYTRLFTRSTRPGKTLPSRWALVDGALSETMGIGVIFQPFVCRTGSVILLFQETTRLCREPQQVGVPEASQVVSGAAESMAIEATTFPSFFYTVVTSSQDKPFGMRFWRL